MSTSVTNSTQLQLLKWSIQKINEAKTILSNIQSAIHYTIEAYKELIQYITEELQCNLITYSFLLNIVQKLSTQYLYTQTLLNLQQYTYYKPINDKYIEYTFDELNISQKLTIPFPYFIENNFLKDLFEYLNIEKHLYKCDLCIPLNHQYIQNNNISNSVELLGFETMPNSEKCYINMITYNSIEQLYEITILLPNTTIYTNKKITTLYVQNNLQLSNVYTIQLFQEYTLQQFNQDENNNHLIVVKSNDSILEHLLETFIEINIYSCILYDRSLINLHFSPLFKMQLCSKANLSTIPLSTINRLITYSYPNIITISIASFTQFLFAPFIINNIPDDSYNQLYQDFVTNGIIKIIFIQSYNYSDQFNELIETLKIQLCNFIKQYELIKIDMNQIYNNLLFIESLIYAKITSLQLKISNQNSTTSSSSSNTSNSSFNFSQNFEIPFQGSSSSSSSSSTTSSSNSFFNQI